MLQTRGHLGKAGIIHQEKWVELKNPYLVSCLTEAPSKDVSGGRSVHRHGVGYGLVPPQSGPTHRPTEIKKSAGQNGKEKKTAPGKEQDISTDHLSDLAFIKDQDAVQTPRHETDMISFFFLRI